jgi:Tfp pilus assembly protein PilX
MAYRYNRTRQNQRGVVLLIALIILVAMTLAGIGMMRSVDTGSVISGNLAFKQATLLSSDRAVSDGYNALASVVNSNNPNFDNGIGGDGVASDKRITYYDNGQPCPRQSGAGTAPLLPLVGCTNGTGTINFPGYFSTPLSPCEVTNQFPGTVNGVACSATQDRWWAIAANWANAPQIQVPDPINPNGPPIATVSYLIHRMCIKPNLIQSDSLNSNNQQCQTVHFNNVPGTQGRYYTIFRITTRSVGSRGTVSYTQELAKMEIK